MLCKSWILHPALGTKTRIPRGGIITITLAVRVISENNNELDPDVLKAQAWSNAAESPGTSPSNWHAVDMIPCSHASNDTCTQSFRISLRVHSSFEFTPRLLIGNRVLWLNSVESNANQPLLNAQIHALEATLGNDLKRVLRDPTPLLPVPAVPISTAQSAINCYVFSVKQSHLSLIDSEVPSLVLFKKSHSWLDPAYSSTAWPTHTFGKEVYAAVWTPCSNEFGLPVFSVLVPLAPYVLDLQPGGEVSIVLSKTAESFWPCFDARQREDDCFGFMAFGTDPVLGFDAILRCIKESRGSKIKVSPTRLIKPPADPEYLAYLGWCTWNSCYRKVSQDSIEHGLKEMQVRGIQIGWLLIDDGWQDVDDKSLRLESLEFNHFKFPSAEAFIVSIIRRYGLKYVGLWHTLAGYWGGISSAGSGYPIMRVQHFDSSEQRGVMNIVHPSSASSFHNEYHKSKQKTLGACMFKIDDQSIWERVEGAQVDSAKQYQDAVIDASFSSPTIWCMAHNLVVLYYTFLRVNLSPWKWMLRSSDDYFPGMFIIHIPDSNSLLLSALDSQPGGSGFLLDWDMFQTDHEFAEYHAIARAISNGPVYISDVIGQHDSKIVDRLCCADGRVVRVAGKLEERRFPLPLASCLTRNLRAGNGLLMLEAHGGGSGCAVVGAFHCADENSGAHEIMDSFVPLRDLTRGHLKQRNSQYCAVCCTGGRSGSVQIIEMDAEVVVVLGKAGATVVTVSPCWEAENGILVACFGLVDKYYGAAALQRVSYAFNDKSQAVEVQVEAGFPGDFLFCIGKNKAVKTLIVAHFMGQLTYLDVHLLYTLPPIAVLAFALRRFVDSTEVNKIIALASIAIIYTTPWDNYIVAKGAWTYPADRVLAVIGYVPIEEYAFFVIQTMFTGLVCLACTRWDLHLLHLKPAPLSVRILPMLLFLLMAGLGISIATPNTSTFYIGALLGWTGPVLALQWWIAGPFIWSLRRRVVMSVVAPTLYLWWVDHSSIKNGVWDISTTGTLGLLVTPHLPIEEAAFFLIVNCMVVFGLLAIDRTLAILRVQEGRIGGRGGRIGSFLSTESKENPIVLAKWTLKDEVMLWVSCTLMHESQLDQQAISDHEDTLAQLKDASSRHLGLLHGLSQPLREDCLALYGLNRLLDDIAGHHQQQQQHQLGKRFDSDSKKNLESIARFVETSYATFTSAAAKKMRLTLAIDQLSRDMCSKGRCKSLEATLRLFSERTVASVPLTCFEELLAGLKQQAASRTCIESQAELTGHVELRAGSLGKAMAYILKRNERQQVSLSSMADLVNNPNIVPSRAQLERGARMCGAIYLNDMALNIIKNAAAYQHLVPREWIPVKNEIRGVENDIKSEGGGLRARTTAGGGGGGGEERILASISGVGGGYERGGRSTDGCGVSAMQFGSSWAGVVGVFGKEEAGLISWVFSSLAACVVGIGAVLRPFVGRVEAAKVVCVYIFIVLGAAPLAVIAWATDPTRRVSTFAAQTSLDTLLSALIAPLLVSFSCMLCTRWSLHAAQLRQRQPWLRILPSLCLIGAALYGMLAEERSLQQDVVLLFLCPILALQWVFVGPFIFNLGPSALLSFLIPSQVILHTNYGIASFLDTSNPVPLFEIALVVCSTAVVALLFLFVEQTFAILRVMESRVGGRSNRQRAIGSTDTNTELMCPWKMRDELFLWLKYALLGTFTVDQTTVSDFKAVSDLIALHSKTFSLASKLYPQPLREDTVALYGFCRISDDVSDVVGSTVDDAERRECMGLLEEFVDACYNDSNYLEALILDISARISQMEVPCNASTAESVLRLFSMRVPRSIPKHCILELLQGYTFDMRCESRVDNVDDLLTYCARVASSVGEACAYLMRAHHAETFLNTLVRRVNSGCHERVLDKQTKSHARDMGTALQLTNIARDLVTDAVDLKRVYVPTCWFGDSVTTATTLLLKGTVDAATTVDGTPSTDTATAHLRASFLHFPESHPELLISFSQRLLDLAQPYAASAVAGIHCLPKINQPAVTAALRMYLRIGAVILQADAYPRRAVVSTREKLVVLMNSLYWS
ncbi:hypothetical protein HDU78_009788 [Chytriomyces hyalinus]|nr:hypothetical protein HDU78_009788 [Chytriomyces hyalinus]